MTIFETISEEMAIKNDTINVSILYFLPISL